MVEGGSRIIQSFYQSQLWDEARIITASTLLGTGIKAVNIYGWVQKEYTVHSDHIVHIMPLGS